MEDFENEIKKSFLVEAKELLTSVEQCFLALEKKSTDIEVLNNIFRLAHNLKGSSGAVGFADLASFTHKLESLLLALKEKRISATKNIVDLLLRSNDHLVKIIDALQENMNFDCRNEDLAAELVEALTNNDSPATEIDELDQNIKLSFEVIQPSQPFSNVAKLKEENIRVSLSRIEKLLNNVGELSILQAVMVQQSLEKGTAISSLMRNTLSAMSKIIKETQNITMGLRMMPVKQTFQKMQRIVRDTSQVLEKNIELHLLGEETEIDKTVLEQLSDPLVHIIRNAVDHGVEGAADRIINGKPESGNIYLSAYHRAGQVVIEVKDDGKGLDVQRLIEKAKAKGVIAQDAVLTNEEAYQLVFAPGFSTKDTVTDVSGRGVGMDVVKTNISALQGNIEIETVLGEYTCFRISLPLTLAIMDSVVVRIGNEKYVVPLSQVSEFFRPKEENSNFIYGRSELLTVRDETLVSYHLSSLINRHEIKKQKTSALTALILNDGKASRFAVMVEQVIAQQQVVIKPLGRETKGQIGLMGSAILGDGRPALILDLFELTQKARMKKSSSGKTMEAA